jgi:hypothetical protein
MLFYELHRTRIAMIRQTPKGDQPALSRFNQVDVVRLTNGVSKAVGHSNSRNDHVVQVASFFSLIRNTAPNSASASVIIEAAQRQMFRSPDGYQAAHYLPGQLKIQNGLPWFLLPATSARQRLENLFADVEHLPAAFNKADSAAEGKGLCETFRRVGEEVLRDPLPPRKGAINRDLVRRIYDEIWVPGATKSYSEAIAQKMLASEVPTLEVDQDGNLNLENISERSTADWSREDEAGILRRYSEALRTSPPALQDGKMAEIERTLQP